MALEFNELGRFREVARQLVLRRWLWQNPQTRHLKRVVHHTFKLSLIFCLSVHLVGVPAHSATTSGQSSVGQGRLMPEIRFDSETLRQLYLQSEQQSLRELLENTFGIQTSPDAKNFVDHALMEGVMTKESLTQLYDIAMALNLNLDLPASEIRQRLIEAGINISPSPHVQLAGLATFAGMALGLIVALGLAFLYLAPTSIDSETCATGTFPFMIKMHFDRESCPQMPYVQVQLWSKENPRPEIRCMTRRQSPGSGLDCEYHKNISPIAQREFQDQDLVQVCGVKVQTVSNQPAFEFHKFLGLTSNSCK